MIFALTTRNFGGRTKLKSAKFSRWLKDADIVDLQETFLDTSALQIAGFSLIIKCARPAPPGKRHRATGGLVTLILSQLSSSFRARPVDGFAFEGLESQCLLFERCDDSRSDLPHLFLFFNFYVVAQPAAYDFSGFYFALEAFLLAHHLPAILVGDFNAHWKVSERSQVLKKPTFVSAKSCTIIDYIFVRGVPSSQFHREELTVFGHRGLSVSLDWPCAPAASLRERTSHRKHFRSSPEPTFFSGFSSGYSLYSHADFIRYGVSRVFSLFVLMLGQLFQVSAGSAGSSSEPWHRYLSKMELEPLLRLEREVFGLVTGAQLGEVPTDLTAKNTELRQLRRSLHSLATRRLFQGVRDSYDDPTRLWAFVRRFRVQQDTGVLPIDTLSHHFTAVFNRVSDPVPMVFCDRDFEASDALLDDLFVAEELEAAFRELDCGTAPGVTGIGNDVLLELYRLPEGPQFFLNLFNACFLGGLLPDLWRCTEIFLLYKGKGDVGDLGSYRGIALMESSLKLYERLLYSRLSRWANHRGLILDCQFGFRARSSTLDAVFVFFTLLVKYVTVKGASLFVCLVDFQKAFPSVNRAQLLWKLEGLGVSSRFRRSLNSIFTNNTFAIRQGSQVTSEFPVTTGLHEGSVLSPLLFILFMSNIKSSILHPFARAEFWKKDPELNCVPVPGLLYADDLVFFASLPISFVKVCAASPTTLTKIQ